MTSVAQVYPDSLLYKQISAFESEKEYDSVIVYADSLIRYAQESNNVFMEAEGQLSKARALGHLNRDEEASLVYTNAISSYSEAADTSGLGRALFAKGNFLFNNEEFDEAFSTYKQAKPLLEKVDDTSNLAKVISQMGTVLDYQGDFASAMSYYQEAYELFAALSDTLWMANGLNNIGIMHDFQGNYDEAISFYQQAMVLREEIGDKVGVAASLNNLGIVNRIQGKHQVALDYYQRSLTIREEVGHKRDIATSLNNIGVIMELEGKYEEALEYHERSLALKEELGNKRGIASSALNIGKIHLNQGRYDEALSFFNRAMTLDKELGDINGIANSENAIGLVQLKKGNYDVALTHFFNVLAVKEDVNDPKGRASALVNIGAVYENQGLLDDALSFYKEAREINEELENKSGVATAINNIGDIYAQKEDYEKAISHYLESLSIREALNDKMGMASCLGHLGEAYLKQNEYQEALSYFSQALQLDRELGNKGGIVSRYSSLSSAYLELERFDEALFISEEALFLADSIGALTQLSSIHEQRTTIFERQGDYEGALISYRAHEMVEDSLFNSESQSVMAELQERYRTREQKQQIQILEGQREIQHLWQGGLISGIILISVIAFLGYNGYRNKKDALAELEETHARLKMTQDKLIHQEKMASLGQLTAGIAHEIKNPLNFVNNFSQLNKELIEELEELPAFESENAKQLIEDLKRNEIIVHEHGCRADRIVRSMMQHTHTGSGELSAINLNRFVDEYVNLAYHGMLATHTSLEVDIDRQFDERVGVVNLVPQEIGQVLINLLNNAFESMLDKKSSMNGSFNPRLSVTTKRVENVVEIQIADNGTGIPGDVQDKIFEPFFTTKPPGSGTGLGLSMSYEIIVKGHGGHLEFETEEGEGANFLISLPKQSG